jgi:hypothetical protein
MYIYIIATILSLTFACITYSVSKRKIGNTILNNNQVFKTEYKYSYILMLFCCLPLFLVSAFRWDVGTDFSGIYLTGFYSIANGGSAHWEPGYIMLNKAVLMFSKDPFWIFFVTSLIFIFFVFKAIYDTSVDIRLSVLFFVISGFYFNSMNGVRQWITLAIFIYSIKYIKQKRFIPYAIVILLASTIHASALIFIPIYFLCQIRIPPKKGIIIFIASMICTPLIRSLFIFIVTKTKYGYYINTSYNTYNFSITDTIVGLIIVILGYIYYNNAKNDKDYSIMMNLQLFALIISIYSSVIFLAYRLLPCFTASQLLFIPLILSQEKNNKIRYLLSFLVVIFFTATCIYTFGVLGWSNILPYKTIYNR